MPDTIRSLGFAPGRMPCGERNLITDVPGVRVGHFTADDDLHHTGLTVILPREDIYYNKCVAACHVINGYGKTSGLVQVEELGTLETPIVLTNTLNVGLMQDALVEYTAAACAAHGEQLRSVNPVVGECNDGTLSRIADRVLGTPEFRQALAGADVLFAQGATGAGRGMICHGLKGGIGSASRCIRIDGREYTLGVLTLCNHGRLEELNICGKRPGEAIARQLREKTAECDRGSCMIIVATDLPVSSRQLKRIVRRAEAGLARVGSYYGHGSGDIAIGFTTAFSVPEESKAAVQSFELLRESKLEAAFAACCEATEEAVLNALAAAEPLTGYTGKTVHALREFTALLQA